MSEALIITKQWQLLIQEVKDKLSWANWVIPELADVIHIIKKKYKNVKNFYNQWQTLIELSLTDDKWPTNIHFRSIFINWLINNKGYIKKGDTTLDKLEAVEENKQHLEEFIGTYKSFERLFCGLWKTIICVIKGWSETYTTKEKKEWTTSWWFNTYDTKLFPVE